jgi:hypothetical protein
MDWDVLASDGAFGAPPRVTVLIPAGGGIELQFDRPAIDARNPARQYSIVLKERAVAAATAQSVPSR